MELLRDCKLKIIARDHGKFISNALWGKDLSSLVHLYFSTLRFKSSLVIVLIVVHLAIISERITSYGDKLDDCYQQLAFR